MDKISVNITLEELKEIISESVTNAIDTYQKENSKMSPIDPLEEMATEFPEMEKYIINFLTNILENYENIPHGHFFIENYYQVNHINILFYTEPRDDTNSSGNIEPDIILHILPKYFYLERINPLSPLKAINLPIAYSNEKKSEKINKIISTIINKENNKEIKKYIEMFSEKSKLSRAIFLNNLT